jgi:hypothetical protein
LKAATTPFLRRLRPGFLGGLTVFSLFALTSGRVGAGQNVALSPSLSMASGSVVRSIDCPDAQTCYAVVAQSAARNSPGSLLTISGGSMAQMQPIPDSDNVGALGCVDTTTCFVVGSGEILPVMSGQPGASIPAANVDFNAISCLSDGQCYAVGDESDAGAPSSIAVPIDAGAISTVQAVAGMSSLTGIFCVSDAVCFATGTLANSDSNACSSPICGGVVTINRGVAEAPYRVPGPEVNLDDLACVSTTVCYAVGSAMDPFSLRNEGAIVTIVDGKPSSPQLVPETIALNHIVCPNTNCAAVGTSTSGNVLATGPAGAVTEVSLLPGSIPRFAGDLDCLSASSCVAGVGNQIIPFTMTGG